tara:strand:- start:725 stop:1648 length:924 start_codon:yes stop_codon:yes gene_type:complete
MATLQVTDKQTYQNIIKFCPRRTIQQYLHRPVPPKRYLNLDVGFFGQFSYQPQAWDFVLKSVRHFYPDKPIVLINDGFKQYNYQEMAKKYNCIHVGKEYEICLHWCDVKWAYEYLERVKEACLLAKTEWIIHLHPDVICCDRISKYPNAHLAGVSAGSYTGVSNNVFPEEVNKFILKHNPNAELNGYGWCGGSIMHVPTFMKVYDAVVVQKKWDLYKLRQELGQKWTEHEDVLFSILFTLEGYVYRVWLDNPEAHRGLSGLTDAGAFLHGFKEHYDFKRNNETDTEYFKRCKQENQKNQNSYQTEAS